MSQRDFGVLKDRVRGHAESVALRACRNRRLQQVQRKGFFKRVDFLFPIAARASHAIGPALGNDVLLAGVIGRNALSNCS